MAIHSNLCPTALAKRRAKTAITTAVAAFVAVGSVAWIGLEAVRPQVDPKLTYSSAPPSGSAETLMMAVKAPREHEKETARLALLGDEDGPMVVKPLDQVVELTQIDRPKINQAATVPTPEPVIVVSAEPEAEPAVEISQIDCVDRLQAFAEAQTIRFGIGSADLEGSELPVLRQIGKMAEACPDATIHVTGHSDTSGSDVINLALSWQRADNTIATLAALGIDTIRFEPIGYGARTPTTQGDASDDELNRRVEFQVFGKAGPRK